MTLSHDLQAQISRARSIKYASDNGISLDEAKYILAKKETEKSRKELEIDYVRGYETGLMKGNLNGLSYGFSDGEAEESERYNCLIDALLDANRWDDLRRAANDEAFRNQLFREFSID